MASQWRNLVLVISMITCLPVAGKAQVEIYRTYGDFVNHEGEKLDDYLSYSYRDGKDDDYLSFSSRGPIILNFSKGTEVVSISCEDIWGFKLHNALFRIDKIENRPAVVLISGSIIYYENGIDHLNAVYAQSNTARFTIGAYSYFSKDLSTEMVPLPLPGNLNANQRFKRFKANRPEYNEIFNCLEEEYSHLKARDCVQNFVRRR